MSSLPVEIKKRSNELQVAEDLCRDMSSNNLFDCKVKSKIAILQDFISNIPEGWAMLAILRRDDEELLRVGKI